MPCCCSGDTVTTGSHSRCSDCPGFSGRKVAPTHVDDEPLTYQQGFELIDAFYGHETVPGILSAEEEQAVDTLLAAVEGGEDDPDDGYKSDDDR